MNRLGKPGENSFRAECGLPRLAGCSVPARSALDAETRTEPGICAFPSGRSMFSVGAVVLVLCHRWKTSVICRCGVVLNFQHLE